MATAHEVNASAVDGESAPNQAAANQALLNQTISGQVVPEQTVINQTADQTVIAALVRANFMQDVSRELAGSLNVRRTMARLFQLATPRLGDWVMLAMFDGAATTLHTKLNTNDVSDSLALQLSEIENTGLDQIRRSEQSELLHIKIDSNSMNSLAQLIPNEKLREQACTVHPRDMLGIGLTARGTTIGALIIVRGEDQEYDKNTISLAEEFAQRAAIALDSARTYEDRAEVAAVVEASLRPPELPEIPGMQIAARYRTAAENNNVGGDVGGDFYDIHGTGNDWLLVLGDVCGKGIEAAVLHGRARQTIRTAAHFDRSPSAILSALNEVLIEDDDTDRFVTLACARLQPDGQGNAKLTLAIAGHPAPIVLRVNGTVEQPQISGTLSGVLPELSYQETTIELHTGDLFLLYTDGIYEAKGAGGFFGMDRLRDLLSNYTGCTPEALCEGIEQSVLNHLNGNPHDDMALLALR